VPCDYVFACDRHLGVPDGMSLKRAGVWKRGEENKDGGKARLEVGEKGTDRPRGRVSV